MYQNKYKTIVILGKTFNFDVDDNKIPPKLGTYRYRSRLELRHSSFLCVPISKWSFRRLTRKMMTYPILKAKRVKLNHETRGPSLRRNLMDSFISEGSTNIYKAHLSLFL